MTITLSALLASSIALNVWLALRCGWLHDTLESERRKRCFDCVWVEELRKKSEQLRKAWEANDELRGRRFDPRKVDTSGMDEGGQR